MKIKQFARVEFNPNPLKEVIAQVKFARNMEIEADLPIAFQKAISERYPLFQMQEQESVTFQIPKKNEAPALFPKKEPPLYHFVSADGTKRVSLTSSFIAFSTTNYKKWETFFDELHYAFEKLTSTYTIPVINRAGLRYKNLIDKKELSLEKESWSELIRPHILGHIFLDGLFESETIPENMVKTARSISNLKLPSYSLNVQTGFADKADNTRCFFIDNDFFNSFNVETSKFELEARMKELHNDSQSIFRHFISDKLFTRLSGQKT